MPIITEARKRKLKSELLNPNNTIKQALLNSGFAPNTAHRSSMVKSVKDCQLEIKEELTKARVNENFVMRRIDEDRDIARSKEDASTMLRADELIGKHIGMFIDRQRVDVVSINIQDQSLISKYMQDNNLQDKT